MSLPPSSPPFDCEYALSSSSVFIVLSTRRLAKISSQVPVGAIRGRTEATEQQQRARGEWSKHSRVQSVRAALHFRTEVPCSFHH
jgi:hypothetical protein